MRRTSPRLLPVLAIAVAVALSVALALFDHVTQRALRHQADVDQGVRASALALELDQHFTAAQQAARTVAELLAPVRSLPEVEGLLRRALASTSPAYVYGVGAWFQPGALEPGRRLAGPYVRRSDGEGGEAVLTYAWSTPAYDYPHRDWYLAGLRAGGAGVFTEPYFDVDHVYRTVSVAIPSPPPGGPPRGVVSVDVTLVQLRRLVAQANISPHEVLYVLSPGGRLVAHPLEAELLAWARAEGRPAAHLSDLGVEDLHAWRRARGRDRSHAVRAAPVAGTGWRVHVATERGHLYAPARRARTTALAAGLLVWLTAAAALLAARRNQRVRRLTRTLEEEARTRRLLEESEARLQQVLEVSTDAVAAVDAQGRIAAWNARACALLGWSREEALGRDMLELLVPAEDRAVRAAQLQAARAGGLGRLQGRRVEATVLRRDGVRVPVEVSLSLVCRGGDALLYAFASDMRERLALLAQLRQRSAELQAVMDNMVEAVFVVDAEARFVYVNTAGLRSSGVASAEGLRLDQGLVRALGMHAPDGQPLRLEQQPLWRALQGEQVERADVHVLPGTPDFRVVRTNAAPIHDAQGRVAGAVAVARDVTAAVAFDRARDEFIRVAAHELKTPLAVVKSFAQLALRSAPAAQAPQRRLLEGIARGTDRMDRVVQDLLDVSQLRLGRLRLAAEDVDLAELARDAVEALAAAHPRREVRLEASGPAPVHGDAQRLRQVVDHLLGNAVAYSPEDAPVVVEVRAGPQGVELAVRDRGIGISEAQRAHLFAPFSRPVSGTPEDRGGLGVGLFIARELVRQQGGDVELDSVEGRGTTARVRLPLRPPAARAPAHGAQEAASA